MRRSRRRTRRAWAVCRAAGVIALALPAVSAAGEPPAFEEGDCEGLSAFISVPQENVDPLLPDEFQPELNEHGAAELLVNGGRCATLDGVARPTTLAEFRVLVADPPFTPLRDPGHYQFWLVSDNPDLVKLFRDGGAAAFHVPGLQLDIDPLKPEPGSEMARVFCDDTDGSFAFADVARGLHFRFSRATFSSEVLPQETSTTGKARC